MHPIDTMSRCVSYSHMLTWFSDTSLYSHVCLHMGKNNTDVFRRWHINTRILMYRHETLEINMDTIVAYSFPVALINLLKRNIEICKNWNLKHVTQLFYLKCGGTDCFSFTEKPCVPLDYMLLQWTFHLCIVVYIFCPISPEWQISNTQTTLSW